MRRIVLTALTFRSYRSEEPNRRYKTFENSRFLGSRIFVVYAFEINVAYCGKGFGGEWTHTHNATSPVSIQDCALFRKMALNANAIFLDGLIPHQPNSSNHHLSSTFLHSKQATYTIPPIKPFFHYAMF